MVYWAFCLSGLLVLTACDSARKPTVQTSPSSATKPTTSSTTNVKPIEKFVNNAIIELPFANDHSDDLYRIELPNVNYPIPDSLASKVGYVARLPLYKGLKPVIYSKCEAKYDCDLWLVVYDNGNTVKSALLFSQIKPLNRKNESHEFFDYNIEKDYTVYLTLARSTVDDMDNIIEVPLKPTVRYQLNEEGLFIKL